MKGEETPPNTRLVSPLLPHVVKRYIGRFASDAVRHVLRIGEGNDTKNSHALA